MTITLFFLLCMQAQAQVSCFAKVELDRNSVYVQQPFKITITVLTATWYTAPLDFDNIQIPNAFILPFDQTSPGMFDVGDKKYAGLTFYFIVFPYKAGKFSVPSINIVATTPPQGSSESKKVTIKTPAKTFIVKAVPANLQGQNWLVAKDVAISERWSKPLNNLKVGDIVERTISIHAKGTLPQFIPQLQKDSLNFANSYLQDAELDDDRDDYDANGSLTQSVIYLLEKEGDFTIPPVKVQWWNPNTSKLYNRSAAAAAIHVKPNPNLGMLATIQDSLNATQKKVAPPPAVKQTKKIWGIAWYWFALIALTALLLLYRIARVIINQWSAYKIRHEAYLQSEPYAFKKFMQSSLQPAALLKNMYHWWDSLSKTGKSSSVTKQTRKDHNEAIENELTDNFKKIYKDDRQQEAADAAIKKELSQYRQQLIHTHTANDSFIPDHQKKWN